MDFIAYTRSFAIGAKLAGYFMEQRHGKSPVGVQGLKGWLRTFHPEMYSAIYAKNVIARFKQRDAMELKKKYDLSEILKAGVRK